MLKDIFPAESAFRLFDFDEASYKTPERSSSSGAISIYKIAQNLARPRLRITANNSNKLNKVKGIQLLAKSPFYVGSKPLAVALALILRSILDLLE